MQKAVSHTFFIQFDTLGGGSIFTPLLLTALALQALSRAVCGFSISLPALSFFFLFFLPQTSLTGSVYEPTQLLYSAPLTWLVCLEESDSIT